jgi:RNA polymerase sigma-70 factor (ECF subfamily)
VVEIAGEGDLGLFQRSQSGDEAAFLSLYRRWQGAIYRYSLRITGSVSIAEDVTQEVFLALMDRASGFDAARGSFSAYLYGIARNHILRRMARERLYAPMGDDSLEDQLSAGEFRDFPSDPLDALTRQEKIDLLQGAVAALPLRYREVVVLCELQELNYAQAAQVIGCPEGTIRSRLHRARALLLKKLQQTTTEVSRSARIEAERCVL